MIFDKRKRVRPIVSTIGRTRILINRCGCGRKFSDKHGALYYTKKYMSTV